MLASPSVAAPRIAAGAPALLEATTGLILVVFGPRTRLAEAVVRTARARSHQPLLVPRQDEERAWCAAAYPAVDTVSASDGESSWRPGSDVAFALCAFGPIHPGRADFAGDAAAAARDLVTLRDLLARCQRAHVVFVSSVLGLWPRR